MLIFCPLLMGGGGVLVLDLRYHGNSMLPWMLIKCLRLKFDAVYYPDTGETFNCVM